MSLKVSVIIPTYGRASLIGRAIESVISQKHEDIEVIIIDDIIKMKVILAALYQEMRVFQNQKVTLLHSLMMTIIFWRIKSADN